MSKQWIWTIAIVFVVLVGIASINAMTDNDAGDKMENAYDETKGAVEEGYQETEDALQDVTN